MPNENSLLTVSLLIPSYGRHDDVKRCLESIACSIHDDFQLEAVVLTDHYDADVCLALSRNGATVINSGHKLPLSESRNYLVKQSTGEIIIFLDDDNIIGPTLVRDLVTTLRARDDVCMTGPLMFYSSEPQRLWCSGVSRSRYLLRTNRLRYQLHDFDIPGDKNSDDFPNCFAIRRTEFEAIGGFNTTHFPFAYSEADLTNRLQQRTGKKVLITPSAVTFHNVNPSLHRQLHLSGSNTNAAYNYAYCRCIFTVLYGSTLQWIMYLLLGQWLFAVVYVVASVQARSDTLRMIRGYFWGMWKGLLSFPKLRRFRVLRG